MKALLYTFAACLLLASCFKYRERYKPVKVLGYRPVYTNDHEIKFEDPRVMQNAGKIYIKDNYIFQVDVNRGIHVFDKFNPASLHEIGFLNIQGTSEISISGNYLYTNAYRDIVVLDISDPQQVKELSRVKNTFSASEFSSSQLPIDLPEHNVYYECFDPTQGKLSGWIKDSVMNNCYFP